MIKLQGTLVETQQFEVAPYDLLETLKSHILGLAGFQNLDYIKGSWIIRPIDVGTHTSRIEHTKLRRAIAADVLAIEYIKMLKDLWKNYELLKSKAH